MSVNVYLESVTRSGRQYWRARWVDGNGKRRSRGLGPAKSVGKREALKLCRQIEYEFAERPHLANQSGTYNTLVKELELAAERRSGNAGTYNSWVTTTERVREWNPDIRVHALTRAHADDFVRHLEQLGTFGDQTIRHHVSRIRTCLNALVRNETLKKNAFDHIPAGVIARDKSWEHVAAQRAVKLIDHPDCDPCVSRAVLLARFAGLRANEIERLEWDDVDHEKRVIMVRNPNVGGRRSTKKRERLVPIDPNIALRLQPEGRSGRVLDGSMDRCRKMFQESCRAARVKPWPEPYQVLRRSCISDWCSFLSPADAAEIAGNSADVIMDHYFKTRPETIAKVAGGGGIRVEIARLLDQIPDDQLTQILATATELVQSCHSDTNDTLDKPSPNVSD